MDAFYASVEQRDNPSLRGKPVVVGGQPQSRGVVASASYEARRFGIRSAMSCAKAYRLCPQTIFVFPHFDKYVAASRQMRAIFESVTPWVEPLALDEAYLDVTTNRLNEPYAKDVAKHIKERISKELQLTASAGVGPNKFIAKLASDFKKPNGLVVIPQEKVFSFIEFLPIEKFWGVGPATAKKLHQLGIKTAADIRTYSLPRLEDKLGSYAYFLYELAHGRDNRPVDPSFDPKSRGTETTFEKDIWDVKELVDVLEDQAVEVAADLKKLKRLCWTVTLKVKFRDFTSVTRSRTLFRPTDSSDQIAEAVIELLVRNFENPSQPIRLIGISVSKFVAENEPLQLWFNFGIS
jgi:DNA polymerase-4